VRPWRDSKAAAVSGAPEMSDLGANGARRQALRRFLSFAANRRAASGITPASRGDS